MTRSMVRSSFTDRGCVARDARHSKKQFVWHVTRGMVRSSFTYGGRVARDEGHGEKQFYLRRPCGK